MNTGSKDVQGWNKVQDDASFKMEKTKQAALNTATAFGEALLPAFTAILGPVSSFLGFIAQSSAASTAFAAIIGGVLSVYLGSKLVYAFSEVAGAGEKLFGTIKKIGPALSGLKDSTLLQGAASKIAAAGQWLLNAAMDANPIMLIVIAIGLLMGGFILAYTHIKVFRDAVNDVGRAIKGAFLDAFNWVKGAVTDVVDFIKSHWQLLLAIITGPIGLAVLAVKTYWSEIKNAASDAWSFVQNVVSTVVNAIKSIITNALNGWVSIITTAWNAIKTATSAVWDFIKTGISTDVDAIKAVLNWFAQLGTLFTGWWNDALNAVTNVVGGLINFVSGIPGKIVSALSSLGADMFNVGYNMVIGIWNGIVSLGGWLYNAVMGFVDNYILNPVKSLLGIGSPSKVFHGYGENVVQGLLNGVSSQMPSLRGQMSGLAATVAGTKIGSPGVAGAAAGAGGNSGTLQLELTSSGDQFLIWLRNSIRIKGGNVQSVLGNG